MLLSKTQILVILISLILSASCQSREDISSNDENVSRLSVKLGAKAELNLVNSNKTYFKLGHKSFVVENLREFIKHEGAQGWTSEFEFPASGSLTGVACQEPNLIGFTNINISEAPKVRKYIRLVKAPELEVKILEPQNSQYEPKELELIPHSKFGVYLKGQQRQIETLCSVRFSHFPEEDFSPYFKISEKDMIMKDKRRSMFGQDLIDSKVSVTEITIMGVARIDGSRVGFTATENIEVVYN